MTNETKTTFLSVGEIMQRSPKLAALVKPAGKYQAGQRVKATIYGRQLRGTVTRNTSGIVWVLWDGRSNPNWNHSESLSLIAQT